MSTDSNTDDNLEFSGDATKTMKMFVPEDAVNEMLVGLGIPSMARAEDLDFVIIEVDHSPLMKFDAGGSKSVDGTPRDDLRRFMDVPAEPK